MNNIKEAVKAISDIELPKDYTQLHDLSELLTVVDMGKKIDTYFDTIKNEFVNNHIKTFDEVLDYIPESKFDEYKIFPGYANVFLPKIHLACDINDKDSEDDLKKKRNQIIKYVKNNKSLYDIRFYDKNINKVNTGYNQTLDLYFDYSKLPNLEILKYVNKFINKFVVDTNKKEIHMYYDNDYENSKEKFEHEFTGCGAFRVVNMPVNFDNDEPILDNQTKKVSVNNTIGHNYEEYIPRDGSWYSGERTHEYRTVYTKKRIEHIFDLKTNQYLKTKVSKNDGNTFYSAPFTFENSKYISIYGIEHETRRTNESFTINKKNYSILSADDFIKEIDKKLIEWKQ